MSLLGDIKSIFTGDEPPADAPMQEYPNEAAPNYWVDQSLSNGQPSYVVPEHVTQPDIFRPVNEVNVPFRGAVDHGVEVQEPSIMIAPIPQELAEQRRDIELKMQKAQQREEIVIPPVAVTVVEMPTPTATEKRIATSNFNTLDNVSPIRIAPRRQQRQRLRVTGGAVPVLISDSEEQLRGGQGFYVPANTVQDFESTGDVWALATAVGPITVYVLEEFSVTVGQVAT